VWQDYPLNRNVPRDSQEQKRKESKERLRWNRIDERCTRHHGCDVMSFLHRHLIYPSSSIVLLSLGRVRASIIGWWWGQSSFRCQRRSWSWVGARISEVTLLSTIVAFLARWVLGWSLVSWGPLNTLILSVWSLKEVGGMKSSTVVGWQILVQ
jgi:hypothetical protein